MKKILVIEAQADKRNLFLEGLKAQGFDTISAENGRIGVQLARSELPDLITCGMMLPELDGYGVLTTLRQYPVTAIIPFIFVAATTRAEQRKGMELGANDCLTEPFTLEQYVRAIAVQLEKQTVLRQWYAAPQKVPETPSVDTGTTSNFPFDHKLNEVFCFIDANYHRSISLNDVAQAVGYSPAYLTHLMRCQTGQTVKGWIISRRMAAARSLLLNTNQIVEQIAAKVGYNNAVHFFRQFRQLHGETPQVWRNAHRQQKEPIAGEPGLWATPRLEGTSKIERSVSPIKN